MNKQTQLVVNIALAVAVAVLFFLHLRAPRADVAPAARATSVAASAEPAPAAQVTDSLTTPPPLAPTAETAAPGVTEEAPAAETAPDATPAVRRVGYVKSGELIEGYKGAQVARAAYEAKLARWEKEHQNALQAFQAAVQQYQAKAGGMLDGQRAEQEQKLQAQEQQVAQRQQQLQQQAAEEEGKLNEQVLGRVNKLLERYGKENDYDLILVAGNGSVAYGRPALDLTNIVLKRLNAEYAAGKR